MSIKNDKLPLSKALLYIFLSVLLVTGSSIFSLLYFNHVKNLRYQDGRFRIIAVVQTGPEKEALKTVYLEELLDLSVDKPSNLFRFDTKLAEKKLLTSPLIKKALIKKIKPGTLYIDYSIRQPIAYIQDYTNTAIDAEGVLIPFKPFFTPKKIPEIYLGDSSFHANLCKEEVWGTSIQSSNLALAFDLLNKISALLASNTSYIRRIDVSKAYSESAGQRQVIVTFDDWFEKEHEGRTVLCIFPRILRLSTSNYPAELKEFVQLREYLQRQELQQVVDNTQAVVRAEPMIIDLRIPQIAFLKE